MPDACRAPTLRLHNLKGYQTVRIALVLLLSALSMQAFAANIGERLTPWTLQDQHDQPYTLDTETRVLLVAAMVPSRSRTTR